MLPNTHSQTIAYVAIQPFAQTFHASDFEVVNPSSDKLVEFIHFVIVAYSPTPARGFLHLCFELCYCLGVWSGFISFGKCVIVKSKTEILYSLGLINLALFGIYF